MENCQLRARFDFKPGSFFAKGWFRERVYCWSPRDTEDCFGARHVGSQRRFWRLSHLDEQLHVHAHSRGPETGVASVRRPIVVMMPPVSGHFNNIMRFKSVNSKLINGMPVRRKMSGSLMHEISLGSPSRTCSCACRTRGHRTILL